MEAIGVLGSVIAIGQALAALPKIIETLRSVGDFKRDFASLLNELATLQALHSQTEIATARCASLHAANQVPPETAIMLENIREQLALLIKDLESLAGGFHHQRPRRRTQIASVVKWQFSRKRVTELYSLANRCRTYLHMAMTMLLLHEQSAQSRLLLEVHSVTTRMIPRSKDSIGNAQGTAQDEHSHAETAIRDSTCAESHDTPGLDRLGVPGNTSDLIGVKTRLHLACGSNCRCQCHASRIEFKSPLWLKFAIGSLLLSYSGQPLFRGRDEGIKCEQKTCRNSQPRAYLQYYFPTWLRNPAISFTAYLSSISGYGATLHMTLPGLIDRQADIWYHIMRRNTRKTALWIKERGVLPADQFDTGITLLSYAVHKGYYDMIKCLLQIWPRSLVQKSYDRNTHAFIERERAFGRVPSAAESTVKQLLCLWDEQLDSLGDFELHGQDEIQPDKLLQRACMTGDVGETKSLISAGVDVNHHDFEGKTPLHLSLWSRNYDCALALFDFGCDLSAKEHIFGNTPLAYAFEGPATERLFQVMCHLVPKTASSYKTMFGCTALHELSRLQGGTHLEEVFQLLIDAGQNIEARHENGETPLLVAVSRNNSAVFKILASAGASLTVLDSTRSSILHYAAHVADAELLRCLIEAKISIDIDLRNSAGFTALDNFRYCLLADATRFQSHWRQPNDEEALLFEELLLSVRDRYLDKEIIQLESAFLLLESSRYEDACRILDDLMEEKTTYHKLEELRTILVVRDLQIRQGMIDAAAESLKDIIKVHRETMSTSPFSQPPVFDRKMSDREDTEVLDLSSVSLAPCCPMVDWNFP